MEEARPIIVEGEMKYEIGDFDINELKLWEDNPRTISKEELERLKKSIKRKPYFMSARPIVLSDRTGEKVIIAGNQRYKAVKELGWAEVPCILFHCETEGQEVEIAMVDNHNNGEWDVEKLSEKFMDYPLEDWLGSDWEKLAGEFGKETKEVKEDEVPEVDDKPAKTKLGDIYQLGKHRLMCGDSTKTEDVEKLMGGGLADMVFTDPPYGNGENGKYGRGQLGVRTILGDESLEAFNGFMDIIPADKIIYFLQWRTLAESIKITEAKGLRINTVAVWDKKNAGLNGAGGISEQWEAIVFAGNIKYRKFGGNVFSISREQHKREDSPHPHQKPIKLLAELFDFVSSCNTILDPFGGSGSTLIACEQLDRTCYMMELDPRYCDVIIERWEKFTGEKARLV